MDVRVKRRVVRRCHGCGTRIIWWHLKNEKQSVFYKQNKLKEGYVKIQRSENDMWNKMTYEIRKLAKETLGELIDFGPSYE
jgi:hypothetical protein